MKSVCHHAINCLIYEFTMSHNIMQILYIQPGR